MRIEKKIRPDKFLSKHEADIELSTPSGEMAFFSFAPSGAHSIRDWFASRGDLDATNMNWYLKFTGDECRRLAYLFEQCADQLAGHVISQSNDGYVIEVPEELTK